MSLTIRNGAPRSILLGTKDASGGNPVVDPELIPTHLPHVFIFAERGPTLPQLVIGDTMERMYGKNTFDYRKQYANHQTLLANTVTAEGNAIMVQRLVPPAANAPASLRLSVDVSCDDIPVYERAADGTYLLDADGNKIPTGTFVPGCKYRWLIGPTLPDAADGRLLESGDPRLSEDGSLRILEDAIGLGATSVGSMTNSAGESSTIYPIMDFEVSSFGSYGNNVGIRFSAPTTKSTFEIDAETVEEQLAYLYRLQVVEKQTPTSSPKVLETIWGEQFVDFTFKPGVIDPRTDKELSWDRAFVPAYSQEPADGLPEIIPPVSKMHVYTENLMTVLTNAHTKEAPYGYIPPETDAVHLMNIFTGHNYEGIPYESVQVLGPVDDGIILSATTTQYFMDGYDGVMNFETHDLAVRHQVSNYGDLEAKVLDSAMYPQSIIYDTGFKFDTKLALLTPIGRRKDIAVLLSTQDVSQPLNTPSEETSIATALRTAARMYPESEVYGTPVCRAAVIGHAGYLLNSNYRDLAPLTIEVAQKAARYMGAGTGIWDRAARMDAPPNNQVKMFKGVNADWVDSNVRSKQWDAGLVWAQSYDRRSLFFPGFQTVYDDDTSVLNSLVNMFVVVELEKIADRVWRDLTGISYLTPGQFVDRSNKLIEAKAKGKFDGRVIVEPETIYTPNDTQRGFSWSCIIHMYAPNMRTVGSFTILAHRIEDYQQ